MDLGQFREFVVRPTLKALDLWSDRAEALLVATAAHESAGLRYIKQVRGPALSFYQIEPPTARDIWDRWLPKQSITLRTNAQVVAEFRPGDYLENRLLADMRFATVTARLIYWRVPEALPKANDVPGMASYWKRFWNTSLGAGTPEQFIANHGRFIK